MKFFRFLTTLIIIQLVTLGARVTAQDITEFEVRVCGPTSPFHAEIGPSPVDDNGHVLPSNQCRIYQESFSLTERCGFSAGQSDRALEEVTTSEPHSAGIDLSPLDFQCMGSGCEYEYENSAREFRANLEALNREHDLNAKKEALEVIDSVFAKSTSIKEVIEAQFAEYEFIPYIDPTEQFGLEPVTLAVEAATSLEPTPPVAQPKVLTISAAKSLMNFWIDQIVSHRLTREPHQYLSDQILDLECRLCGTATLNLYYDLKDSIRIAQLKIEHEKELALVQQNALILNGFSSVIRMMGRSLIDVSDSIEALSRKKVEVISKSAESIR